MPTLEAKTNRLLVLPTDLFIEYQIDLARVNSRQPGVYGSRRIGLARRPRQSVVVAAAQGGARVRWQVSHGSELRFCSGPYLGVGCPVIIPVLGPHDGLLATKDSSSVNRALSAKLSAPASLSKPTLTAIIAASIRPWGRLRLLLARAATVQTCQGLDWRHQELPEPVSGSRQKCGALRPPLTPCSTLRQTAITDDACRSVAASTATASSPSSQGRVY